MTERLRRRSLSPWNEYSLPLTAPSFTREATSELFRGHVESNVSLQCTVGRLIITSYFRCFSGLETVLLLPISLFVV